jgi:hypothetical protein
VPSGGLPGPDARLASSAAGISSGSWTQMLPNDMVITRAAATSVSDLSRRSRTRRPLTPHRGRRRSVRWTNPTQPATGHNSSGQGVGVQAGKGPRDGGLGRDGEVVGGLAAGARIVLLVRAIQGHQRATSTTARHVIRTASAPPMSATTGCIAARSAMTWARPLRAAAASSDRQCSSQVRQALFEAFTNAVITSVRSSGLSMA